MWKTKTIAQSLTEKSTLLSVDNAGLDTLALRETKVKLARLFQ